MPGRAAIQGSGQFDGGELRKDPPRRSGRKGLGICRRRKRIVDIRADACEEYERKGERC